MSPEKRALLAIQSAQSILARRVEPGGLNDKATIDALLTVLDDTDVVEAVQSLETAAPATGDQVAAILQALYDSEINYTIATFWDAGFRVLLGDDLNGFVAETRTSTFVEAVQWLALATLQHLPDSEFARKYRA